MTCIQILNGFAVLKKGERVWKAMPISKPTEGLLTVLFGQDGVEHYEFTYSK
jgi:hypothetical protein